MLVWRSPGVLPRSAPGPRDGFSPAERALLQPGDIVLRRSVGLTGDLIVRLMHDETGISHGAMVLDVRSNGHIILIQSINASLSGVDGVQTQDLGDFSAFNAMDSLVVVRPRWPDARRLAALHAAEQLLARHVPFDNNYKWADHSALYCSELLWYVLELSGWQPSGLQPALQKNLLSFRSFLDPVYFQVLISHNPAVARF